LEIRKKEERLNFESEEREEKLKLKKALKIASQQQTLLQLMLGQLIKNKDRMINFVI